MKEFKGFQKGMGIGGWLTNYKRFHVLSADKMNVLTIGDKEHFNTYITEKDVHNIAKMGFDHIRLGFDQVVLQDENGNYREENFILIDNFIKWCEKYSLNVVLNLHKAIGSYCDVQTDKDLLEDKFLQQRFIDFWLYFEQRYSSKKQIVFELLNEVKDVNPLLWNNLYKQTIKAIREHNQDRKIIVGTINWNDPNNLKDLEVLEDENVIYTFHFYAPFEFTHQRGVLQHNTCLYNRDMPYPTDDIARYVDYRKTFGPDGIYDNFTKMDKEYIYHALKPAKDFIKANPDKILWCGEFGNIRHAKLFWREAWFKDVISFLKENEIPYSVWNYLSTPNDGNRFSLVDDDNRKILSRGLRKILLGKF